MAKRDIVDIFPFRIDRLPDAGFELYLGRRGTGKTTLCRYVTQQSPRAQVAMHTVIAGSDRVRQSWAHVVPPLYVHEPSVDILRDIINDRKKLVSRYTSRGQPFPKEMHLVLILDDVASITEFMKSSELRWLASNGRHAEITVRLLAQYVTQVIPEIRSQFDIIYVMATANRRTITTLQNEFVSCVTPRVFRSVLSALTQDHGALVIDNRSNGMNISDCVFELRASVPVEERPLGSPAFIAYAKAHYLDLMQIQQRKDSLPTMEEAEEDVDENDEDQLVVLDDATMNVLNSRRVYADHLGRIIVRRVPAPCKPKTKIE